MDAGNLESSGTRREVVLSRVKGPQARTVKWIAAVLAAVVAAWLAWEILRWPDVERLASSNPSTTAFIERHRRQQRKLGRPDRVLQAWLSYDEISPNLKKAVLVAEDINFFSHDGFDTEEIREAVREAVEERRAPRGASTISQQLARNLWLSPSRNPVRKLKEALLTAQLERALTKERILELYLNVAEFGPGVYGAEAAAQRYFGKSARWLNRRQAARLAATLPSPSTLNPDRVGLDHWRVDMIRQRVRRATFLDRYLFADVRR